MGSMTRKPRNRRAALIRMNNQTFREIYRSQQIRLPTGIQITAWKDEVEEDSVLVRIEGDNLPDACEVPKGARYIDVDFVVPSVGPNEVPTLKLLFPVETEHIAEEETSDGNA